MTEPTETNPNALAFTLPETIDNTITVEVDLAALPDASRARLLSTAVRQYIMNRVNTAAVRYRKDKAAYDAEIAKDATFTGDIPALPNYAELAGAAKSDMLTGDMRDRGDGTGGKRAPKDPLDAVVTTAVVRELFSKRKAATPSTKYIDITKEVGASGIAYLNARADAAAGDDEARRAVLAKKIETEYLAPARKLLGINAKGEQNAATDDDLI